MCVYKGKEMAAVEKKKIELKYIFSNHFNNLKYFLIFYILKKRTLRCVRPGLMGL